MCRRAPVADPLFIVRQRWLVCVRPGIPIAVQARVGVVGLMDWRVVVGIVVRSFPAARFMGLGGVGGRSARMGSCRGLWLRDSCSQLHCLAAMVELPAQLRLIRDSRHGWLRGDVRLGPTPSHDLNRRLLSPLQLALLQLARLGRSLHRKARLPRHVVFDQHESFLGSLQIAPGSFSGCCWKACAFLRD